MNNQPAKPVGPVLATACLLLAALRQLASCLHLVLALSCSGWLLFQLAAARC